MPKFYINGFRAPNFTQMVDNLRLNMDDQAPARLTTRGLSQGNLVACCDPFTAYRPNGGRQVLPTRSLDSLK